MNGDPIKTDVRVWGFTLNIKRVVFELSMFYIFDIFGYIVSDKTYKQSDTRKTLDSLSFV